MRYEDAVAELFQAPHAGFVAERKRLAGELKAAGDKAGATRLGKLNRPPISAWVVNQLWWHARDAFEAMLESAERVREGDLKATGAHRETIAKLRARAAALLADAGHAATDATLRRVQQTLAALAASGGFDPDPPGALTEDRDPPGFEALGIGAVASAPPPKPATKPARDHAKEEREARERAQAAERAEAAAERRRAEEAEARRRAERHRLEAALRTAAGDVETRTRELERARDAVTKAEQALAQAQAIVADLQSRLDQVP